MFKINCFLIALISLNCKLTAQSDRSEWESILGSGIVEESGINRLTKREREHLMKQIKIKSIITARRIIAEQNLENISSSAESYLESEGWKKIDIKWGRVKDQNDILKDAIIVKDKFKEVYSTDLPFGVTPSGFRVGKYWAKTKIFGGVSEIIKSDGSIVSFLFSDWKEVP